MNESLLKETNLGMAQVYLTLKRYHSIKNRQTDFMLGWCSPALQFESIVLDG